MQRYARALTWQELVDGKWQQPRSSKLDPFKPHLTRRWEQGCQNVSELYREITKLGFAASLEGDLAAVTRGLTTRWNSGPVEGRVNHIKTLKRWMYGRAGLPLLRKRVLLTAAASRPRPSTTGGDALPQQVRG